MKNFPIPSQRPNLLFGLFCILSLLTLNGFAQVGIGTITPDASAILDINSSNKGVSLPNVILTSVTDATTITSPKAGLMVYNTNNSLPCGRGLYFNNGTVSSPFWACFSKTTQYYHAYGTSPRSGVTSSNLVLQPGCLINFTVPTGQIVDVQIFATLGAALDQNNDENQAIYDTVIGVDGPYFLDRGGFNRNTILKGGSGMYEFAIENNSITTVWQNVGPGNHTVGLYSSYYDGNTPLTIGGDCLINVNCGEIHIVVNYR